MRFKNLEVVYQVKGSSNGGGLGGCGQSEEYGDHFHPATWSAEASQVKFGQTERLLYPDTSQRPLGAAAA